MLRALVVHKLVQPPVGAHDDRERRAPRRVVGLCRCGVCSVFGVCEGGFSRNDEMGAIPATRARALRALWPRVGNGRRRRRRRTHTQNNTLNTPTVGVELLEARRLEHRLEVGRAPRGAAERVGEHERQVGGVHAEVVAEVLADRPQRGQVFFGCLVCLFVLRARVF